MYKIYVILYFTLWVANGGIIPNSDVSLPKNFSKEAVNKVHVSDSYEDDYNSYEEDEGLEECKLTANPPSRDSNCCGIDVSTKNRIVGGSETLLNQYPWLALIEYESRRLGDLDWQCGGSLISGFYVLTAAHCLSERMLKKNIPRNVVLGDFSYENEGKDCTKELDGHVFCSEGAVRIGIQWFRVHESYRSRPTLNDIALIKLNKIAPYTDFIRPICLPSFDLNVKDNEDDLILTIVGWGVMKQDKIVEDVFDDTISDTKRHVNLSFVSIEDCKSKWPNAGEDQICAGGSEGQDACMGDSGGPLMLSIDGTYELTGVVSYGASSPCGMKDVPGVYTNVYRFRNWIKNIINN